MGGMRGGGGGRDEGRRRVGGMRGGGGGRDEGRRRWEG